MVTKVDHLDQEQGKSWDAYVYGSQTSGHGHLSGWRRVIEGCYGHRAYYIWNRDNGQVKGILPLILIRSRLFGRSLVSLPFLDEGGICSDNEAARNELYQEAGKLVNLHGADSLDLRHRQPSGLGLPSNGGKVTLALELSKDPEKIWNRFDSKLRNQIRKAVKSDLTVSWCGLEGLSDFYEVFASNMRDLGSPVHDRSFFDSILNEFPDTTRLIIVRKGKQAVGGGLCLLFRDIVSMPWASSLKDFLPMCPNNLLYWEAIRWACEKGYRKFDFGRSSPGSGTYKFKKQWEAVEERLHWESVSRTGQKTNLIHSDDPGFRLGSLLWKRMPLTLTKWIGPVLRKQMSN
jgi:serine/alanine adding enzyme